VLVSLLVLPLYTPVLIFGASAVTGAATGQEIEAQLSLLGAFLALALTFAPWAAAAALRVSLD
jgi:heme exporter protein B